MELKLLHEDEHIIVVNKPAGFSVLPDGWDKDAPYLVQTLEADHGKIWVVHRLDKTTSGVMVFARNAQAHRHLNIQFEKRGTEKIYHAIANGSPAWNEKTAKHPLRVNVGHKHRTVVDSTKGKRSETRFMILKRYQQQVTIEARPLTGRAHQIRVHAYALGIPLLGDVLYGAPESALIARPALHAYSLSFTHPVSNERVRFAAPYPDDFVTALEGLNI